VGRGGEGRGAGEKGRGSSSPQCYRRVDATGGWSIATESLLDFLPVNLADCSPFSMRQRD